MKTNTIKLPNNLIQKLIQIPESGMGFQFVNVVLKSGKVLNHYKIINAELLVLNTNEKINIHEIEKIELEITKKL